MSKKVMAIIVAIIVTSILLYPWLFNSNEMEGGEYEITNINIYKNTPAWELALAVKKQKTRTIEKIAKKDPELLNYQESKYGATLLIWAIGMEKYKSAEALLKCGADPNIALTTQGETPLFIAVGFSWVDYVAKKDPKYVQLLLRYGADTNKNFIGKEIDGVKTIIEPGTSPLMHSIGCGIEKTKALVEAGADINYKTQRGYTVAMEALSSGGGNTTLTLKEYAHYLIVEKKAIVSEPYYRRVSYGNEDPNQKFFPVDLLRDWICDIDSKEYKMKMEIVEEFAHQGVNYWETKIPNDILQHIKKLYPDTWQDYIKKY